jgi:hypothetical protein
MGAKEQSTGRPKVAKIGPDGQSCRTARVEVRADLVSHLLKQGPVDGESQLSFRCKMAWLKEGRQLWLDAWRAGSGVMARAARILGIANTNARRSMRQFGLSRHLLDYAIDGKVAIDS